MNAETFHELMNQASQLTLRQRELFRKRLDALDGQHQTLAVIELPGSSQPRSCPHCQGTDLDRHGQVSGLQRYRCQACHRTFNALTETALARLRKKDKWLGFSTALVASQSLRQAVRLAWGFTATPRCAGATAFSAASRPTAPPHCRASRRLTRRIFWIHAKAAASWTGQPVGAAAKPVKRACPASRCAFWWRATVLARPWTGSWDVDK